MDKQAPNVLPQNLGLTEQSDHPGRKIKVRYVNPIDFSKTKKIVTKKKVFHDLTQRDDRH